MRQIDEILKNEPGLPLLQCDLRVQHPLADDQQAANGLYFCQLKALWRAGKTAASAIRGDRLPM